MELQGGRRGKKRRRGKGEERQRSEKGCWRQKFEDLEKWRELKERERRRRNVVKRVEVKGEGIKEAVRKIWEEMEVSARIEEIKEVSRRNGKERGMVIVRMEDKKGKDRGIEEEDRFQGWSDVDRG